MLTEVQMGMCETLFEKASDLLFAVGEIPQAFAVCHGTDAIVMPLPSHVPLGSSVAVEFAQSLAGMEGTDMVIFVSEIWRVVKEAVGTKREDFTDENWQELARKELGGKTPSQHEDKSEALMMLVLEVANQKLHMKLGDIKRDAKGGAYVDGSEWMPEADFTDMKTTIFPQTLNS